ncbi:hypothetical protein DFJ77DRAFT_129933 [Powellomyces hirtus]|nr:hypothetical protein DFJ77DRAFT_129933 [Powellomyces hirtus]
MYGNNRRPSQPGSSPANSPNLQAAAPAPTTGSPTFGQNVSSRRQQQQEQQQPQPQLPSAIKTLRQEGRAKNSRPISNLLSQLEDFSVEMSPTIDSASTYASPPPESPRSIPKSPTFPPARTTQQRSQPEQLQKSMTDISSRRYDDRDNRDKKANVDDDNDDDDDDDDDDDFGSSQMLADLEKLLPGRGKAPSSSGRSGRPTPPNRSTSSTSSTSRSSSRAGSSRAGDSEKPQPATRLGSMTAKSVRTNSSNSNNLVVPPRIAVSPSITGASRNAPSSPLALNNVITSKSSIGSPSGSRRSSVTGPTSPDVTSMPGDTTLFAALAVPIAGAFDDIIQLPSAPHAEDTFMPGGRRLSSFTVTSASSMMDVADGMIMDLMVQEAMGRTVAFRVLPSETYDARKKELRVAAAHIRSLQKRLTLEMKIKEAAVSLAKFDSGDKAQNVSAKEQLAQAEGKVEAIGISLWRAVQRMVDAERTVFKHIAGVLRWSVTNMQENKSTSAQSRDEESMGDLRTRLESAEIRIKEQQRENMILQNSVARLTLEQEPLRKLAERAKKEARMTRQFRDKVPSGGRGSNEHQLKLELATAQADAQNLNEELDESRDNVAKLQLQLDEHATVMEEKDRTIADLLAEVEEITNQADMKAAAAAVESSSNKGREINGKSSRSSMWYREQVVKQVSTHSEKMRAVLGVQLKDAVLERERLKLQLNEQLEITKELKTQVDELREQKWLSADSASRDVQSGDDLSHDDGVFNSPQMNYQGTGGTFGAASGRAAKGAQDILISDLRRQITKSADAMAISDQDSSNLRKLYDQLSRTPNGSATASPPNGRSSFSVDALVSTVQNLVKERTDLQSEVKDLQRHVARMSILEVELDNARGNASRQAQDSGTRDQELRNALRKVEEERDQFDDARAELEKELGALKISAADTARDLATRIENHRDEITDLEVRHDTKLKQLNGQLDEKEEIIKELQEDIQQLKASRQQLETSNADLLAKIDALSEQSTMNLGRQTDDLRKAHQEELTVLKNELEKARKECNEVREHLEEATWQHSNSAKELEARHDRDTEDLRLLHDEELSALNQQLATVTQELSRIRPAAKQGEEAMRAVEEEHARRVAEDRRTHDAKIAELNAQLDNLSTRLELSESTLVSSKQQFFSAREQLQEQIDQAIHARSQVETSLAQTTQELDSLTQRYEELNKEVEDAQNRAVDAEEEANAVTADLERLRSTIASRDNDIAQLQSQLKEKSTQLNEALAIQAEIADIQDTLVAKDDAIAAAQKEADEARRQLKEQEVEYEQGKTLLETMQNMLMEMKKGKAGMLDEIEDCKYREEMMRRKLDGVEAEKNELSRTIQSLQSTNSNLQQQIDTHERELSTLNTKLQDLSINKLGSGGDATATSMRAEFRKMVNDLRSEHQFELQKQVDLRRDAERELRRMRREDSNPNINS